VVLSEPSRDLAGEIVATDRLVEELRREESGLTTRLGAKLEEGNGALESVLTELREVKARRRTLEAAREQLHSELEDEASRLGRIEATIAAIEEARSVPTLDHSGKRQALSDLGVRVAVYPSWHESPYRWVMSAFEMKDGRGRRLWVDGEALKRVSAAASPSRRRGEIRADSRGRGCQRCGTQHPITLRWTSDNTEPREAA
jgi:seryl-tRNA synthetase